MRDWVIGTLEGDRISVAPSSDGSYGINEGLVVSVPCYAVDGEWVRIEGPDLSEIQHAGIECSVRALREERGAIKGLLV